MVELNDGICSANAVAFVLAGLLFIIVLGLGALLGWWLGGWI